MIRAGVILKTGLTTEEYIRYVLGNYHQIIADIDLLKEELEFAKKMETEAETIEALTFTAVSYEGRVQTSGHKDPTARIAMIYERENERAKRCIKKRMHIEKQLQAMTELMSFIERAFLRLEKLNYLLWITLTSTVIDGYGAAEYAAKINVEHGQVSIYRKEAIKLFAKWWNGIVVDVIE